MRPYSSLKPGRRRSLTAAEREQAAEFKVAVQGRPCVVCGETQYEMEEHDGIEASFLRAHFPALVYDRRNAVPVCPWWIKLACHGDHTSRMRPIPRASLPESVEAFASELNLGWLLDRIYGAKEMPDG